MTFKYRYLILGSGPIAASTAYHLAVVNAIKDIGIVTQDPTSDHAATYLYAGGSIRWFWDDKLKEEMTTQTSEFIKDLLDKRIDFSAISDNYLFLHRGKFVPSLNISGVKYVKWLLDEAQAAGADLHSNSRITKINKVKSKYNISTETDIYIADKVLLALGVANEFFMPAYKLQIEKRQLFVLDINVDENSEKYPHVIFPLGNGMVYSFIKNTSEGFRFVVGQEDVVEPPDDLNSAEPFDKLLKTGLRNIMPFLNSAKVEKVLWGLDAGNKKLRLETEDNQLFVANCGSAIRSSIWIGNKIAQKLIA